MSGARSPRADRLDHHDVVEPPFAERRAPHEQPVAGRPSAPAPARRPVGRGRPVADAARTARHGGHHLGQRVVSAGLVQGGPSQRRAAASVAVTAFATSFSADEAGGVPSPVVVGHPRSASSSARRSPSARTVRHGRRRPPRRARGEVAAVGGAQERQGAPRPVAVGAQRGAQLVAEPVGPLELAMAPRCGPGRAGSPRSASPPAVVRAPAPANGLKSSPRTSISAIRWRAARPRQPVLHHLARRQERGDALVPAPLLGRRPLQEGLDLVELDIREADRHDLKWIVEALPGHHARRHAEPTLSVPGCTEVLERLALAQPPGQDRDHHARPNLPHPGTAAEVRLLQAARACSVSIASAGPVTGSSWAGGRAVPGLPPAHVRL